MADPRYAELPFGMGQVVYDMMKAACADREPDLDRPTAVNDRKVRAWGFVYSKQKDVAEALLS